MTNEILEVLREINENLKTSLARQEATLDLILKKVRPATTTTELPSKELDMLTVVRKACQELMMAGKEQFVKDMLAKYNARKLTEVPENELTNLWEAVKNG